MTVESASLIERREVSLGLADMEPHKVSVDEKVRILPGRLVLHFTRSSKDGGLTWTPYTLIGAPHLRGRRLLATGRLSDKVHSDFLYKQPDWVVALVGQYSET